MSFLDKQYESFINDSRFEIGMKLFNSCEWYKSHDVFEEIWHETGGPERQLIQGILQVAVAQVHLENNNINGATILYGEALGRLKRFQLNNCEICCYLRVRWNKFFRFPASKKCHYHSANDRGVIEENH